MRGGAEEEWVRGFITDELEAAERGKSLAGGRACYGSGWRA